MKTSMQSERVKIDRAHDTCCNCDSVYLGQKTYQLMFEQFVFFVFFISNFFLKQTGLSYMQDIGDAPSSVCTKEKGGEETHGFLQICDDFVSLLCLSCKFAHTTTGRNNCIIL